MDPRSQSFQDKVSEVFGRHLIYGDGPIKTKNTLDEKDAAAEPAPNTEEAETAEFET
jgi:hypothetical protein